jgi:hypothetical protein
MEINPGQARRIAFCKYRTVPRIECVLCTCLHGKVGVFVFGLCPRCHLNVTLRECSARKRVHGSRVARHPDAGLMESRVCGGLRRKTWGARQTFDLRFRRSLGNLCQIGRAVTTYRVKRKLSVNAVLDIRRASLAPTSSADVTKSAISRTLLHN